MKYAFYQIVLNQVNDKGRHTGTAVLVRITTYGEVILMSTKESSADISDKEPQIIRKANLL